MSARRYRYDLGTDGLDLGEGHDVQPGRLGHLGGIGDHPIDEDDVTEGIVLAAPLGLAKVGQFGPAAHHARHAGLIQHKVDGLGTQRIIERYRRTAN